MPKRAIRVYLSKQQVEILQKVTGRLGMDYSGFFQMLFMNYIKDINLVTEVVHQLKS